jgi:hypothetical protein
MLTESFRRQLYLDGQYGQIVFVATKADNIIPSEARSTFHLERTATKRECAMKRSEHVKQSIVIDFQAGLKDLASQFELSGSSHPSFELPVVCVSSMQYQMIEGLRESDDEKPLFRSTDETGIPELQCLILERALESRREKYEVFSKCLKSNFQSIEHALQREAHSNEHEEHLRKVSASISDILRQSFSSLDSNLKSRFDGIRSIVEIGIGAAATQVEGKAAIWERENHQTLKAAIVRSGAYNDLDLNEGLAGPILNIVADRWRSEFHDHIPKVLKELLCSSIKEELESLALGSNDRFHSVVNKSILTMLHKESNSLKCSLLNKQRDLTRTITPEVDKMFLPSFPFILLEVSFRNPTIFCLP